MKTFEDILMRYRGAQGITSWESAAALLGVTESGLRAIRRGKGGMKERTLRGLAQGTGLSPGYIVAVYECQFCRDEKLRLLWCNFLKLLEEIEILLGNHKVGRMCIMLSGAIGSKRGKLAANHEDMITEIA